MQAKRGDSLHHYLINCILFLKIANNESNNIATPESQSPTRCKGVWPLVIAILHFPGFTWN